MTAAAPRFFVIGDIHGRLEALNEVLDGAGFDDENDTLVILGDVVDGGTKSKGVIDRLLRIRYRKFILGNHDAWFLKFIEEGWLGDIWLRQGGVRTLRSYGIQAKPDPDDHEWERQGTLLTKNALTKIPVEHRAFLKTAYKYHIASFMVMDGSMKLLLFLHGGLPKDAKLADCSQHELMWNRSMTYPNYRLAEPFDYVYIGHTQTANGLPAWNGNILMLDTGAGWDGRLTLCEIKHNTTYELKNDPSRLDHVFYASKKQRAGGRG